MNVVFISGNLVNTPEVKEISTGKGPVNVANFRLASSRKYKKSNGDEGKEVVFVDCEAWDAGAVALGEYYKKGDPVLVQGALKLDEWEDKEGQKRSKIRLKVTNFEGMGRRNKTESKDEEF